MDIEKTFDSKQKKKKANLTKCGIAGILSLKGVQVAVCGMKCIDLCNEFIKIWGTYFSYSNKITTK